MAVYKIFPEKDSTIYSGFPLKNTGIDEILEISNFYDTTTPEVSRALVKFSQTEIEDVVLNIISGSTTNTNGTQVIGSASFQSNLKLYIGDNLITENGGVSQEYNEEKVKSYLKDDEIKILVLCGKTKSEATVWTCDLTHDYIDINSSYRS